MTKFKDEISFCDVCGKKAGFNTMSIHNIDGEPKLLCPDCHIANITDRTINVFEARIMELITITDITKLPQWTDADVIAVHCLIKEYRKMRNK